MSDFDSADHNAIVINRGVIERIGSLNVIKRRYPGQQVVSFKNAMLLPGLVNTHAHLELPYLLDPTRAKTFPGWVLNLILHKKTSERKRLRYGGKERISNPL